MSSGTGSGYRFRLAVEASPAAMIMTGPDGLIEFANAETERMFHYSVEELIGRSIDELVPQRMRGAHAGLLGAAFSHPRASGRWGPGAIPTECARTEWNFRWRSRRGQSIAKAARSFLATVIDITALSPVGNVAGVMRKRGRARQRATNPVCLRSLARPAGSRAQNRRSTRAFWTKRSQNPMRPTSPAPLQYRVLGGPRPPAGRQPAHLLPRDRQRTQLQPLDLRAEVELALSDSRRKQSRRS